MLLPLLVSAFASFSPSPADAALLTSVVAQGASANAGADVVTSSDLRSALGPAALAPLSSCVEGAPCMASIAASVKAQIVVSGALSAVEDVVVLQLSAFDVAAGRSGGRRVVRAASLTALLDTAEVAARELVAATLTATPGPPRRAVLVLDVAASSSLSPPTAVAPPVAPAPPVAAAAAPTATPVAPPVAAASVPIPPPVAPPSAAATSPAAISVATPANRSFFDRLGWWSVAGTGAALVGVAGVVGGVWGIGVAQDLSVQALDPTQRASASRDRTARAETYAAASLASLVAGNVLVVGGVGAVIVDGFVE